MTPPDMPLAAAGGLACCPAGGEVSGTGPGDVILGVLVISPVLPVVVVGLLFGSGSGSGWIVTASELLLQENFCKTTLPEE